MLARVQDIVCCVIVSYKFNEHFCGPRSTRSLSRISQNSARYAIFSITPFFERFQVVPHGGIV